MSKDRKKHQTKPLKKDPFAEDNVSPFSDKHAQQVIPWVIDFHIGNRLLQVQVKEQMVIGRGSGAGAADVDLGAYARDEHGVSRRHAILLARSRFLTIRDLNSTNGTFINGLRLMANQDVPLEHGDMIAFGNLEAQLMFAVLPPHKRASADSDYQTLKPVMPGGGRHVLVIEDDDDVALAYQMMLRTAGYRVTMVADPSNAVEFFMQEMPDAVVVDLQLHHHVDNFGGLDVIDLLTDRAQQMRMSVPVIVVSGMVDDQYRQMAMQAGATLFLPKPIRVDELAVRIGMLLHQLGSARA